MTFDIVCGFGQWVTDLLFLFPLKIIILKIKNTGINCEKIFLMHINNKGLYLELVKTKGNKHIQAHISPGLYPRNTPV